MIQLRSDRRQLSMSPPRSEMDDMANSNASYFFRSRLDITHLSFKCIPCIDGKTYKRMLAIRAAAAFICAPMILMLVQR